MKFSRRDFLSFAGFTVLGVAGGRYFKNQLMPRESYYLGNDFRSRHEEIRSGICGMCPAGCGIHVRLIDGEPVKIDGNPDCPVSRGKLCPKGQMGLELHYNPDRIASPLKRVGPAGSNQWATISWDEALALLSKKIGPALTGNNGKGVTVISHDEQSLSSQLWSEFNSKYAERSQLVRINTLRDNAILSALQLTMNTVPDWPVYDIENADMLLVFDTPVVSGWSIPTLMIGEYSAFRRTRDRTRGKMIFVGSRRSMDATSADFDLRIKPYSSAVLALGLAHVIIREGRYDEKFVARYCTGFDKLKTLVLKNFKPKTVSDITGASIENINAIARQFSGSKRPIAIGERIPEPSRAWEQTAFLLLNALKGSIGVKGGIRFQEKIAFGRIQPKKQKQKAVSDIDSSPLERMITEIVENNVVPDVLVVDKVDPATTVIEGHSWSETLKRIPFVVSFCSYPNMTTSLADLVLPDLDFLEKTHDFAHPPALGYPSVVVSDAPVPPGTKGMDSRVIQIAMLDDSFLSESTFDKADATAKLSNRRTAFHRSLFSARRGLIYDTQFTREWIRRMETGGWWSSDITTFDSFDEKLRHKGGWVDPYVEMTNGNNSVLSSKVKFNMKNIADTLPLEDILAGKTLPEPPDISEKPWMRMAVLPTTILSLSSLPYGNIPHLLEFPDPGVVTGWKPWIEIHSSTASLMKLSDEDVVLLKTNNDERKCRIVINDGVHPDVGAIPFGMFGLGTGTWLQDNMKMPLEGLHDDRAERNAHRSGMIVRIRKV